MPATISGGLPLPQCVQIGRTRSLAISTAASPLLASGRVRKRPAFKLRRREMAYVR
jgi:hypothetical protein